MRGTGRRVPPPKAPLNRRDSDASFASSRPSSVGTGRPSNVDHFKDRSYQHSAVRFINAFLSHHSFPIALRPPLPSAHDIHEVFKFVLSQLDWPLGKLDEELPVVLKGLGCPYKVNKSAIRTPSTPTSWPSVCAVLHWLTELASISPDIAAAVSNELDSNAMLEYTTENYKRYIQGDDEGVAELDREFLGKVEQERDFTAENVRALEESAKELERKVKEMKSSSQKEELEKQRVLLEEDANKFRMIIDECHSRIAGVEKVLEAKQKELASKLDENKRISEENAELKRQVESQVLNARDVERMRRELQALDKAIEEYEASRSALEDKAWDLDSEIGKKFKEIEHRAMEGNRAMRRLKLPDSLQYKLNAKGSTPAEVMGLDYKSTLKPALKSLADDIKKSSMGKLEELISLEKQSQENVRIIDAKKKMLEELQSYINKVEAHIYSLRKEMEDHIQKCEAEQKKMEDDVQWETYNLETVEREVEEIYKTTKLKLQEVTKQTEDEVQMYARELFRLIDSLSKLKEYTTAKISEMKNHLSETLSTLSKAQKDALQALLGSGNGALGSGGGAASSGTDAANL